MSDVDPRRARSFFIRVIITPHDDSAQFSIDDECGCPVIVDGGNKENIGREYVIEELRDVLTNHHFKHRMWRVSHVLRPGEEIK